MPTDPTQPALTRHPPEHGRQGAPEILPAGCCCCCCCCCLHTLGGIGGAVIGSSTPMARQPVYESDPDSPFPYRRDVFEEDQPLVPPVLLYWLMVVLTVILTVVATPLVVMSGGGGPKNPMDALPVGLFIAVMILPALQLVVSLFAVVTVAIFYPERSYSLRRLGKITLWSFGGTAIGLLLMGGCIGAIYLAN